MALKALHLYVFYCLNEKITSSKSVIRLILGCVFRIHFFNFRITGLGVDRLLLCKYLYRQYTHKHLPLLQGLYIKVQIVLTFLSDEGGQGHLTLVARRAHGCRLAVRLPRRVLPHGFLNACNDKDTK